MDSRSRAYHLAQANANLAISGLYPDESDLKIQAAFVAGTATIEDMIADAKKFAIEQSRAGRSGTETHYEPSRLYRHELFPDADFGVLQEIARANPLDALLSNPRWREESAIDFAYTSAQIEGNSYTREETICLLKLGITAKNKRFSDAAMIVNLRTAYDYILDNASLVLEDPTVNS